MTTYPPVSDYLQWNYSDRLGFVQGYFRVGGTIVRRKLATYRELGLDGRGQPISKSAASRRSRNRTLRKAYLAIEAQLLDESASTMATAADGFAL